MLEDTQRLHDVAIFMCRERVEPGPHGHAQEGRRRGADPEASGVELACAAQGGFPGFAEGKECSENVPEFVIVVVARAKKRRGLHPPPSVFHESDHPVPDSAGSAGLVVVDAVAERGEENGVELFRPGEAGQAEVIEALGDGPLTPSGSPVEGAGIEFAELAQDQGTTCAEGLVQLADIRA